MLQKAYLPVGGAWSGRGTTLPTSSRLPVALRATRLAPDGQPSPPHRPGGAELSGDVVSSVWLSCGALIGGSKELMHHTLRGGRLSLSLSLSLAGAHCEDSLDGGLRRRPRPERDDVDAWDISPRRRGAARVGRIVHEAAGKGRGEEGEEEERGRWGHAAVPARLRSVAPRSSPTPTHPQPGSWMENMREG